MNCKEEREKLFKNKLTEHLSRYILKDTVDYLSPSHRQRYSSPIILLYFSLILLHFLCLDMD